MDASERPRLVGLEPMEQVELGSDGGRTLVDAEFGEPVGRYAWRPWSYEWDTWELGEM